MSKLRKIMFMAMIILCIPIMSVLLVECWYCFNIKKLNNISDDWCFEGSFRYGLGAPQAQTRVFFKRKLYAELQHRFFIGPLLLDDHQIAALKIITQVRHQYMPVVLPEVLTVYGFTGRGRSRFSLKNINLQDERMSLKAAHIKVKVEHNVGLTKVKVNSSVEHIVGQYQEFRVDAQDIEQQYVYEAGQIYKHQIRFSESELESGVNRVRLQDVFLRLSALNTQQQLVVNIAEIKDNKQSLLKNIDLRINSNGVELRQVPLLYRRATTLFNPEEVISISTNIKNKPLSRLTLKMDLPSGGLVAGITLGRDFTRHTGFSAKTIQTNNLMLSGTIKFDHKLLEDVLMAAVIKDLVYDKDYYALHYEDQLMPMPSIVSSGKRTTSGLQQMQQEISQLLKMRILKQERGQYSLNFLAKNNKVFINNIDVGG